MSNRISKRAFRPAGVERLEQRRVMTAPLVTAFLSKGFLEVDGTRDLDHIKVERAGSTLNVYNQVESLGRTGGGLVGSFDVSKVRYVVVYGKGGDDVLDVKLGNDANAARIHTSIIAGDGNAQIFGNIAGANYLQAGNGNSTIHGGNAEDYIIVGDGNSSLLSFGSGNKEFHTGNGNFSIAGGTDHNYYHLSNRSRTRIEFHGTANDIYAPDSPTVSNPNACPLVNTTSISCVAPNTYTFQTVPNQSIQPRFTSAQVSQVANTGAAVVATGNNNNALVSVVGATILGKGAGNLTAKIQTGSGLAMINVDNTASILAKGGGNFKS